MKPFCAVDFESFWDGECSVKPLGTVGYTRHPKFDAYMVSIWCPEVQYVGDPYAAPWDRIRDRMWLSHNAGFDIAVHQWLLKQPKLPKTARFLPLEWNCTSSLAVYLGAPRSLAGAAKFLLQKNLSKGMRNWAKGKSGADIRAAGVEPKSGRSYWDLMCEYGLSDSEHCYHLWARYAHHWPEAERRLSRQTYIDCARGVYLDLPLLRKNLKHIRKVNHEAELAIPWTKEGEKPTSPKALRRYCADAGIPAPISVDEKDERYIAWEGKYGDTVDWVDKMRTWRKSNTILKRLETMDRRVDVNGCMTFGMKYFGAHTGRWSGDEGVNMTNPPRDEHFGINVRKLIVAPKGFKFVIVDLAQIEPRCLAWLCGDEALLQMVRDGFPIYEVHARKTMGWNGGKLKAEDPAKYALAKARVLSLGYGAGAAKFVIMAKNYCDIDLPLAEAEMHVAQFRMSNPKITKLWNQLDIAFKRAGLIRKGEPNIFHLELPSGRVMRYLNVSLANGARAQTTMGGIMKKAWGGLLTENLTQATAREVFVHGLSALHAAKIHVPFHLYDEYVCQVPTNFDKREIVERVTRCPSWIEGLPLEAEAVESDFYKK